MHMPKSGQNVVAARERLDQGKPKATYGETPWTGWRVGT